MKSTANADLSDAHGAQYVQKYKGAFGVIVTGKIPMGETLYPSDGKEGQSGDDSSVEYIVEHTQERCEGKSNSEHGLHLDQGQVSIVILQSFLLSFDLFLLLLIERIAVSFFSLFD